LSTKEKVKEINFNVRTEKHDLEVKVKKIKELLTKGHRVRTNVHFKGREISHPELGFEMMSKIMTMVAELGKSDKQPTHNGKSITVELKPLK
jgi:translation initiation factor IF-3